MKLLMIICIVLHTIFATPLYQWGEENVTCRRMRPNIYSSKTEVKDKTYYRIVPDTTTFYPGQKLHVRIMGKHVNDKYIYSGMLLAVMQQEEVVGHWDEVHPEKFRRLPCSGKENAAIAGGNETMFVEDDVYVWVAPESCNPGNRIYDLNGTVVKNSKEVLTGLSVQLECVDKKPEEKMAQNSCKESFSAGLSNTSFETDFGSWWNDPTARLRWIRHKGPTPSPRTGPTGALSGDYYVYAEASRPAKEGDKAVLNSPPGLRGCFCVRFHCHAWVSHGSYFTSEVNGNEMWEHKVSANKWMTGWQSVNDANYPLVQLVMHRGQNFRGDIALDDVTIEPGLCPEDVAGKGFPIWKNLRGSS